MNVSQQLDQKLVMLYDMHMQGTKSEPVTQAHFGLLGEIILKMRATIRKHGGIGLAGIQVGIPLRLAVITIPSRDEHGTPLWDQPLQNDLVICNPEIVNKWKPVKMFEGCLSIPGAGAHVTRFDCVRVKYQDEFGEWKEGTAVGLLAQALQHEVDHMNGEVYLHLLSSLKRGMILRNLKKRYPGLNLPK